MTDLLAAADETPAERDRPTQPPARSTSSVPPFTSAFSASGVSLGVATVLAGLFGGFFLTYSASVQLGLAQVDDLTYVRTFQAINATIRNPAFAVMFFGCVPAIAIAWATNRRADRRTALALATGGVLCAAVVVITFVFNVPLNNELATWVDPTAAQASRARADFETVWNRWNLARTILSVAGAVAVAFAAVTARRADAGR